MFLVCERWVGDKDGLLFWPRFFLTHSSTSFSSWLGLLNRGSLRAAKSSGCKLILTLSSYLQLTWTVWAPGYTIVSRPPASAVLLLIYTGASFDWRFGRGSIYNTRLKPHHHIWYTSCVDGLLLCRDAVDVLLPRLTGLIFLKTHVCVGL